MCVLVYTCKRDLVTRLLLKLSTPKPLSFEQFQELGTVSGFRHIVNKHPKIKFFKGMFVKMYLTRLYDDLSRAKEVNLKDFVFFEVLRGKRRFSL